MSDVRLNQTTVSLVPVAGKLRNGDGGEDAENGHGDEEFEQREAGVLCVSQRQSLLFLTKLCKRHYARGVPDSE